MKNKGKNNYLFIIVIVVFAIMFLAYLLFRNKEEEFYFAFDVNSVELKLNDAYQIKYKLSGEEKITWTSEDTSIASVDSNGIVSANSLGSTVIKGSIIKNDKEISNSCLIDVYMGDKNVYIQEINVMEGELFISTGDTYNLEYNIVPNNSYITSIMYHVDDPNVVAFDGTIKALSEGSSSIRIIVNGNFYKEIKVNVVKDSITPMFSKKLERVILDDTIVNLKVNEEKEITYHVEPVDSYISSVKWESTDPNVVEVDSGIIKAKASGNAKIILNINGIESEVTVNVSVPVTGLTLTSNEKILIKEGKSDKVSGKVLPDNASNKTILYRSNNASSLNVDQYGNVRALKEGTGTIIMETEDGKKTVSIPFRVNPRKGVVNGDGGVWGYTNSKVKTPTRAGADFFSNLARKGIGTFSGNVYTYNVSETSYSYDISSSILKANNRKILMRIYYPPGVDLSSVNTFTFFGGAGECNMSGYFSTLDRNLSYMKSSGIIILVSAIGSDYHHEEGIAATNFVKSIVKQKSGMRNSVAGYSRSGPEAAIAAEEGNYDRLMIFDSYFSSPASRTKLKNMDIVFYSPNGDTLAESTYYCLERMKNAGYTDVTVVTNNSSLIKKFSDSFLIINPGSSLGTGHAAANITNSNFFAYACE